jgi:hypothetical protein
MKQWLGGQNSRPDYENMRNPTDYILSLGERGLDVDFGQVKDINVADRANELQFNFLQRNPNAANVYTKDELLQLGNDARGIAMAERAKTSRKEFETITPQLWSEFLTQMEGALNQDLSKFKNLSPDEIEQVANFQHGSPPSYVQAAQQIDIPQRSTSGDIHAQAVGRVTQPDSFGSLWKKFYDAQFTARRTQQRLGQMGLQSSELEGLGLYKEQYDPNVINFRNEQRRAVEAGAAVNKAISRKGTSPEVVQDAIQSVQKDPTAFEELVTQTADQTRSVLGVLFAPLAPVALSVQGAAETSGLDKWWREVTSEATRTWAIALAADKDRAVKHLSLIESQVMGLPGTDEQKKALFEAMTAPSRGFSELFLRVNGHDPKVADRGFLGQASFLTRKLASMVAEETVDDFAGTVFLAAAGAPALKRLTGTSKPKLRMGKSVVEKIEALPDGQARLDFVKEARNRVADELVTAADRAKPLAEGAFFEKAKVKKFTKNIKGEMIRMHRTLNRMLRGDNKTVVSRLNDTAQWQRDLQRTLNKVDTPLVQEFFDVWSPEFANRRALIGGIEQEIGALDRAAAGERVQAFGNLKQAELDALWRNSKQRQELGEKIGKTLSDENQVLAQYDVAVRQRRAVQEELNKQLAKEQTGAMQIVNSTENIRALAQDAVDDAAARTAVNKDLLAANMEFLETANGMLTGALKHLEEGGAAALTEAGQAAVKAAVKRTDDALGEIFKDLGTDRPPPQLLDPPENITSFNEGGMLRELRKTADQVKKLSAERLALLEEGTRMQRLLEPNRLDLGNLLDKTDVALLRRAGNIKHLVPAKNLNEAARRALEVNPNFLASAARRPPVKLKGVPENMSELAQGLSRTVLDDAKGTRMQEVAFLEEGLTQIRLSELSRLPGQEQLRQIRSSTKSGLMLEAHAQVQANTLIDAFRKAAKKDAPFLDRVLPGRKSQLEQRALRAREEIFEALRSQDLEQIAAVGKKYGDELDVLDRVRKERLTTLKRFGIIKEKQFDAWLTTPWVKYLYDNKTFVDDIAKVQVRPGTPLDIDPSFLKHRIPEDADLLVWRDKFGEPQSKFFDSVEAAKEWSVANVEGQAMVLPRWGPEARNSFGLVRDVLPSMTDFLVETGTTLHRRVLADTIANSKFAIDEGQWGKLPLEQQKNFVQIKGAKDINPIFENLEGRYVHKQALREVALYRKELDGFFSFLDGSMKAWFDDMVPDDIARDTQGKLGSMARRTGFAFDNVLRKVPAFKEGGVAQKALQVWKTSKIALSVPAGFMNFLGNFFMAFMARMPGSPIGIARYVKDQREFIRKFKDPKIRASDPLIQALAKGGKIDASLVPSRTGARERTMQPWEGRLNLLERLEEEQVRMESARVDSDALQVRASERRIADLNLRIKKLGGTGTKGALRDGIRDLKELLWSDRVDQASARYGAIDSAAAYAVAKHLTRVDGLSAAAAVERVNKFMQNYTVTRGGVQHLAGSPFTPVPRFLENVVRSTGNAIKEQPLHFLKPMMMNLLWNEVALAGQGMTVDEMMSHMEAQRRFRSSTGVFSGVDLMTHTILPIPGARGAMLDAQEVAALGMFSSDSIAGGRVAELMSPEQRDSFWGQAALRSAGAPLASVFSGPMTQAVTTLGTGIDTFTGRSVDAEGAGIIENLMRRAGTVIRGALPAGSPGSHRFRKVTDLLQHRKQGITGKPRDPARTIFNMTGIPARAWTQDQSSAWLVFLNADESGSFSRIAASVNLEDRELREAVGELGINEQVHGAIELLTKEKLNAAGERVQVRPKDLGQKVRNKLVNYNRIGRGTTFARLPDVDKIRTLADHWRMRLPASTLGALLGEWMTPTVLSQDPDPTTLREFAVLIDVIGAEGVDWLKDGLRFGAEYQRSINQISGEVEAGIQAFKPEAR